MDIGTLSMDKALSDVQTRVGVAMLAKGMDAMREQGAALAKLIISLPPPASALMPEGVGTTIDTFA